MRCMFERANIMRCKAIKESVGVAAAARISRSVCVTQSAVG